MDLDTKNILLVEDDPGQARLVEKLLARAGIHVAHVPGAHACLTFVRDHPTSIVVLDRGLPDGDGLDVLRQLRAEFPSLCVIMLTGADDAAVAVDAMRLGASDYVVKRPDLSHLTDLPLVLERNRERLRLQQEHDALNRAVQASEARYRELFDNASDAIFVCAPDGTLQQVNQTFLDMTGCERAAAEGQPLDAFLAPDSPTHTAGLRERSLRAAQSSVAEVHLTTGGRLTILDVKTRPIHTHGAPNGFQGIGRDVTERRKVDQMQSDFLAMVTHDMKNPISIIVGYTEIMLDDRTVGNEWREMLVSMDSSARGLLHLIMNFLDLSRIEGGALRLHRSETSINDLVRQVITYQAPLARVKGIRIVEDLAPVPLLRVDRTQLERVFVNLIGNAIKFSPPAGEVRVHSIGSKGAVEVRVSDSGPGIPAEQVPQLFGKYQRLAVNGEVEGTGLGLFIAKSMVDAHGGVVRVENARPRGTTFVVSLPVAS